MIQVGSHVAINAPLFRNETGVVISQYFSDLWCVRMDAPLEPRVIGPDARLYHDTIPFETRELRELK